MTQDYTKYDEYYLTRYLPHFLLPQALQYIINHPSVFTASYMGICARENQYNVVEIRGLLSIDDLQMTIGLFLCDAKLTDLYVCASVSEMYRLVDIITND